MQLVGELLILSPLAIGGLLLWSFLRQRSGPPQRRWPIAAWIGLAIVAVPASGFLVLAGIFMAISR